MVEDRCKDVVSASGLGGLMRWFICRDGICDFCADGSGSFVWGIGSSTFFGGVGHGFVFEGRDDVCGSFGGGGRGGVSWGSGGAGEGGESLPS